MYENDKITSVCVVTGEENFITRIADVYEKRLVLPNVNRAAEFVGVNRDKLYFNRKKNLSLQKGDLGVWNWTVSQGRIDLGKEWIESEYKPQLMPIEVLDFSYNDEEIKIRLKEGLNIPFRNHRRLILYDDGKMRGVLCEPNQMEVVAGRVRLKEDVYILPVYNLKEDDFFDTIKVYNIGEYCLYYSLTMPKQDGWLYIRSLKPALKKILKERFNSKFKEDNKLTRKDKTLLHRCVDILPNEDLIDSISS